MSPVPWNRAVAPVCALLGGAGLARVPARRPVTLPALLRPRPCTPHASIARGVRGRGPSGVRALHDGVLTMTVDTYRRRIASTAIVLAREDPLLVKEVIARLRASGEIAADDLVYLDRIADRWIGIAEGLRRGAARVLTT
jgi:hypothetical protein